MKLATIKLAQRITLNSKAGAKAFGLERQFENYLTSIKDICVMQGLTDQSRLPIKMLNELEKALETIHLNSFAYVLKETKPLNDVSDTHKFDIADITLKLKSYDIPSNTLELDIFCITGELHLIDTIGTFAIIEKNIDGATWAKTLTVALSHNTTIYAIKATPLDSK
ncbi:MAG TPA: hypothetical protein VIM70_18345 [Clostridium sp.]|jgi:hypothetical protein|uniref:hypothetical protein n=1 Tax=Bacteria TaxID=2 RepID=UPI0025C50065|nr:hypothetical protein [Flavobacterium sp. UBA4120]